MLIQLTCVRCVKSFRTSIPQESWDQYQDGTPPEIAFHGVSDNARNLIVDKMCPTCWAEVMAAADDAREYVGLPPTHTD